MNNERDYTIAAVKRALEILKLFDTTHRELSLSEISEMSGIGKSSVLRILYTLLGENFLFYDADTKKYRLGVEVYRLGSPDNNPVDLRYVAHKYLRRLSDATGMLCYLGARQGDKVIYLERVTPSSLPIWAQIMQQTGGVIDMYSTGIGRLLLSADSDEEVMAYLDRVELRKFNELTIVDKQQILELVRQARREKISGNDGENEPYIYSICAPIYNMNGKIRAAISLGGMKEMIYSDRREEYTEMVRKTAEDSSAELGYLPRV